MEGDCMEHRTSNAEHRTSSVECPRSQVVEGGGGCFCRNIVTNRINIGYFCCFCRNIGRNKPRRCRNKGVLCGLLRIVSLSGEVEPGGESSPFWLGGG